MPIYDTPTHRVTLYSMTSGTDSGGGVTQTYASAQSAVPCVINTASASTVEMYSQQAIRVSHTVAVLASTITVSPARGWKIVTDDRSQSLHVEGIRHGRAMGGVPAFYYFDCSEQL